MCGLKDLTFQSLGHRVFDIVHITWVIDLWVTAPIPSKKRQELGKVGYLTVQDPRGSSEGR